MVSACRVVRVHVLAYAIRAILHVQQLGCVYRYILEMSRVYVIADHGHKLLLKYDAIKGVRDGK